MVYTANQLELFFIGLSVLIIALELPLAMNLIKPNRIYGFRVQRTLEDERVWYLANSYAGRWSILAGIISMISAVSLRLITMSTTTYGTICFIILIGGLMLTTIKTLIYMKRIP